MKIFDNFKQSKKLIGETDYLKIYKCIIDDKEYHIVITRRFASRRTFMHCENNNICCEQIPILPRMGGIYGEKVPVYKWDNKKEVITIFVIRGRPGIITGLDTGVFRSASKFDENYLNVMSYRRFKKI